MFLPETHRHYLYYFNSLAVFWFLAFVIVGPKYSIASSSLLLLSLLTLPAKLDHAVAALKKQLPWVLGVAGYCLYHIAYRHFEGLPPDKLDPPFRYLAAIPILIYLQIHGFSRIALGLGAAAGCLLGGGAGIHEVLSGQAARAGSTIAHHPIPYGTLVALLATLAICCACSARNLFLKGFLLMASTVGLVAAIYSGTRGLYPAVLLALAYLGYSRLRAKGIGKISITLVLAALAVAISLIAYQFPTVEKRIEGTVIEIEKIESGNLNTSIGHRLQMWHTAIHLFTENPLFGAGNDKKERSSEAAAFLSEHGYTKNLLLIYDHFHNEYLHALAAHGLAGFVALVGLLWGAVRSLPAGEKAPLATLLIVIGVEALTEVIFIDTRLTTAFIFLVTLLRVDALRPDHAVERATPTYDSPLRIPQKGL